MKKIFSDLAIVLIVFTVTFLFSCESNSYCCNDQHASASQCSTCTNHIESNYSNTNLELRLSFFPSIVGQIDFVHPLSFKPQVILTLEHPPAIIS